MLAVTMLLCSGPGGPTAEPCYVAHHRKASHGFVVWASVCATGQAIRWPSRVVKWGPAVHALLNGPGLKVYLGCWVAFVPVRRSFGSVVAMLSRYACLYLVTFA